MFTHVRTVVVIAPTSLFSDRFQAILSLSFTQRLEGVAPRATNAAHARTHGRGDYDSCMVEAREK